MEQRGGDVALTEKQARFVAEYLVDLDATKAAKRAGYSEKTAYSIGFENLRKPEIQEAIQTAMDARSKRTEITQDMVLQELARIAFANGTDFAKIVSRQAPTTIIDDDGNPQQVMSLVQSVSLVDTDDVDPEKRAAIASIKEGKFGIEVKSYDKVKALELLGQHLGMFTGKDCNTEHETDDGFMDALKGEAADVWQEE
jgi:phage terminase small subunit